jgi:hypothetical protein
MTLLDAINTCLSTLGEARVTSTLARNPTVDLIKSTIDMKKDELLERGWWFNIAQATMYPSPSGEMEYPVGALSVLGYDGEKFVPRDGMLFDLDNNTKYFTEPKSMQITYDVDFEDLPECAANVVMQRANRAVYSGDLGMDNTVTNMQQNELMNFATLETMHMRNQRHTTRKRGAWRRMRNALKGN